MPAAALRVSDHVARPSSAMPAIGAQELQTFAHRLIPGEVHVYDAKAHLFHEGDPASHVYRVESGVVCVYRTLADGRRQIVDLAYPGDVVGLGSGPAHNANAQAIAATRVSCMPVKVLQDVIRRDASLGLALCGALSRTLQATQDRLLAVGRCTAGERLAGFLLSLSRRNGRNGLDPNLVVLPITRSDIADFLGLTTETVSRTFTAFRAEGLIDLEQGVLVAIRDIEGLTRLAHGDHRSAA